MKTMLAIVLLTFSSIASAEVDITPYLSYTNEVLFIDDQYDVDTHEIHLGADIGKYFYVQAGPATFDGLFRRKNLGTSAEVGFNYAFGDRVTISSSWYGVYQQSQLNHSIETNIRINLK